MGSFTEENYLKIIYKLSRNEPEGVTTNAIAEVTQTKPSSVSDMLKKLSDKSLIDYKKYQGVKLTEEGERIALRVIRSHRLWEVFLAEKLEFHWDEVHEIAEELEHIDHPLLINRLDRFLNFPEYDPHGDPIPKEDGKIIQTEAIPLAEMPVNQKVLIAGLKESSNAFLQYLDKLGLKIGTSCHIAEIIPFDGSVEIKLTSRKKIILSKEAARNILVSCEVEN
jgi:DtxR family Mn-dependent transcriptional regulator